MRILSLDGGGILGLVPAMQLAMLEQLQKQRCASLFDVMAGTSTGGILACALAIKTPAAELVDLYLERGRHIFSRSWLRRLRLRGAKYNGEGLAKELESVFGDMWLSEVTDVRLLVPAYDIVARKAVLFDNLEAQQDTRQ